MSSPSLHSPIRERKQCLDGLSLLIRTKLARFVIGLVSLTTLSLGCTPATPVPSSPRTGSFSHTTGASAPEAPTFAIAQPSRPEAMHQVKKPVLPPPRLFDPWHSALETQIELDQSVDSWVRATRNKTTPEHMGQILILRRIHGTGGFLRQTRRYIAAHPSDFPDASRQSLAELEHRWQAFEELLAQLDAAQEFAQQNK
jgi:hypothetical protein